MFAVSFRFPEEPFAFDKAHGTPNFRQVLAVTRVPMAWEFTQ